MRPVLLAALLAAAAPAFAQSLVSDSTAFLNAVRDRDGATANRLLETGGATVLSARNGEGDTALHIAIKRRDADWLGFLLGRGADPDLASRQGEPPIVAAARIGFLDGVTTLLARGARVDAPNRRGETALIAAVQSANTPGARNALPLVQRLLRAGADPNKTDSAAGYSALDYARQDRRNAALVRAMEDRVARPAAAGAQGPKL